MSTNFAQSIEDVISGILVLIQKFSDNFLHYLSSSNWRTTQCQSAKTRQAPAEILDEYHLSRAHPVISWRWLLLGTPTH